MASTGSPRDHVADANPDISRKRQRFSEELPSPASPVVSPVGSPPIELLPPEESIGASMIGAIMIDDDLNDVEPYSSTFDYYHEPPISQLKSLLTLRKDAAIDREMVYYLNAWLERHLSESASDGTAIWLQRYTQDEEFFGSLARLLYSIINGDDLQFDDQDLNNPPALGQVVLNLIGNAVRLCTRIILVLVDLTEHNRPSRRDSVQNGNGHQEVNLLWYIEILAPLLCKTASCFTRYQSQISLDANTLHRHCKENFAQDENTLKALTVVFHNLALNNRSITNSWPTIRFILKIVGSQFDEHIPLMENILEDISDQVLPAICGKHPRALPEGFHEYIAKFGARLLKHCARNCDVSSCAALFQRFIQSDDDAMQSGGACGEADPQVVLQVNDDDPHSLPWLLSTAYVLQTHKAFILSDIIDVRTCGIQLLSKCLVDLYNEARNMTQETAHPVAQYAARFLRTNEITKYIFSADSHASLVAGSENIVSFLAATQSYTDQETDIIWQACTTNVEAEFVKASVNVLRCVCGFLCFDHLCYVIARYSTTPISKLSTQAVELLPELFAHLQMTMPQCYDQESRLAAAGLGIDLFRHLNSEDQYSANPRLWDVAVHQIARAAMTLRSCDRVALYQPCTKDVKEPNEQTTTSIQIIRIFLQNGMRKEEAEQLLKILPVEVVVDEICHCEFNLSQLTPGPSVLRVNDLVTRLDVVIHMLDYASSQDNTAAEDLLYHHIFGERAGGYAVRHEAWVRLRHLGSYQNGPRAAGHLMDRYLSCHVAKLPAQYATVPLIHFIVIPLKSLIDADAKETEKPRLLDDPLWKALVRFASEAQWQPTANCATEAICELLLSHALKLKSTTAILKCQLDFIQTYVDHLCVKFSGDEEPSLLGNLCQSISVIRAVYMKSKDTEAQLRPTKLPDIVTLGDVSRKGDTLRFTMNVDTSRIPHSSIHVKANHSATVSQLAGILPKYTAATENRIIINGFLLDIDIDGLKPLSQVGIPNSGGIMICPKYTFDCDVNKILSYSGPVETAIMEQYDRLSHFIDGPVEVARSAFDLLAALPPSKKARSDVALDGSVENLFPSDRPWRTKFSVSILQRHLEDLARLGVAHADFLSRGISLLTHFILDESQIFHPVLFCSVLDCLLMFLREKPISSTPRSYFDRPKEFTLKLVDVIFRAKQLPQGDIRSKLAESAYQTLLQASTAEPTVWQAFVSNQQLSTISASLLLDDDLSLSCKIAEMMINICQDERSPSDARPILWSALYSALPQALIQPTKAEFYFKAALELLNLDDALRLDESKVRGLIEELTSALWDHTHTEIPDCPLVDQATFGVLRLLADAISILKGFKTPLRLDKLAPRLFKKLLFPPLEESSRPLLNAVTRKLVYDVVKTVCASDDDYRELFDLTRCALDSLVDDQVYPGEERWIRPWAACSGLSNLGMTCYMNSLLQQLFANLSFRKFIFTTPVIDPERQALLVEVQFLFVGMQNAKWTCTDTSNLAKLLDIKVDSQEDVHGFYATFLSGLEDAMPDADVRTSLKSFFTGNFISQVKGDCGHVSTLTEPFIDLSITVKNKTSLEEGLDEFVQGEPMRGANKYRCLTCDPENDGRLVDAMKRTCLDDVPDNLTFCLKRFTFEAMMGLEGKVNDQFSFPPEIDMAKYHRSHLENPGKATETDNFELVGVIVHQGDLAFGHYWSYVRLGGCADPKSGTWVSLEDAYVRPCPLGIHQISEECFGGRVYANGNMKTDNAYVLFYQRQTAARDQRHLIEPVAYHPETSMQLPPRVMAPIKLQLDIDCKNRWQYRVEHLFSPDFTVFNNFLLGAYTELLHPDEDSPLENTEIAKWGPEFGYSAELDTLLARITFGHLFRIRLCDPHGQNQLKTYVPLLRKALSAHPSLAHPLLKEMANRSSSFLNTWRYQHASWRKEISRFVEECLKSMKETNPHEYADVLQNVLSAHGSMKRSEIDNIPLYWGEYFGFAGEIAAMGTNEAAMVLDAGSFNEVLEILTLISSRDSSRGSLWNMIRRRAVNMTPLFAYLHNVMSEHVDLNPQNGHSNDLAHKIVDDQVQLSKSEWHRIVLSESSNKGQVWILGRMAFAHSQPSKSWEDFAPGKFVSLLLGSKFQDSVVNTLRIRYEVEDQQLEPLLQTTLHLCTKFDSFPDLAYSLLVPLSKILLDWDGVELKCLAFWRNAYKIVPMTVIDILPQWVHKYFGGDISRVWRSTAEFLRDCLLVDPPAVLDPLDDVRRMYVVRLLARVQGPALINAYTREDARRSYNDQLSFLTAVREWQSKYIAVAEERLKGPHLDQTTGLKIELPETKTSNVELIRILDELNDWDADSDVVTFSPRSRRRYDCEDGDGDISDDGDDEGSSFEN